MILARLRDVWLFVAVFATIPIFGAEPGAVEPVTIINETGMKISIGYIANPAKNIKPIWFRTEIGDSDIINKAPLTRNFQAIDFMIVGQPASRTRPITLNDIPSGSSIELTYDHRGVIATLQREGLVDVNAESKIGEEGKV